MFSEIKPISLAFYNVMDRAELELERSFVKRCVVVFILLGLVSLFADIAYEGTRSIVGAYIRVLQGPALAAGIIGVGELLGYVFRYVSGILSLNKPMTTLWALTICGYIINAVSIPALAFAGTWDSVLLLVFLERIGKGIRAPARDVILSETMVFIGKGKGFAIHEVLDQIGAVVGPLLVAMVLTHGNYQQSFIVLGIPATIAVMIVILAARIHRTISGKHLDGNEHIRKTYTSSVKSSLDTVSRTIIVLNAVSVLSFIHWGFIAYYLKDLEVVSDAEIGVLYLIAMLVDAAIAIPIGWLYDRIGLKCYALIPPLSFVLIALLLTGNAMLMYVVATLWGTIMAFYEVIPRAAIADYVSVEKRGYIYGTTFLIYGFIWSFSTALISLMYQMRLYYLILIYVAIVMMLSELIIVSRIRLINSGRIE